MAGTISRFTSSLLAGSQENTLALASLNFDFSLYKIEAPMEYQGLGSSLSHERRQSAEGGPQHVTARKLGALFRTEIPSVPNLIKAYGKRVSQIAQGPVDPRLLQKDGIFADKIGIDGTSIWAAATSGSAAQGMQLLACMLARFWTAQEATSIWVELVETQRQVLLQRQGDFDFPEILAMQGTLSREQLAEWDASTRAWLRTADFVKAKEQTQLRLILENVTTQVNNKPGTYESVMDAWISAMTTIDKLVAGIPQSVHNGSVLLGLSAWHLYPDMLVYESEFKEVNLVDPLISRGGILTVGLEMVPNSDGGVRWSLPLAKLRYYGEPVMTSKTMDRRSDRVSFNQLTHVVLGCLLHIWNVKDEEYEVVCAYFSGFWECIINHKWPSHELEGISTSWIKLVANATNSFLNSKGAERQSILRLIGFGVRRCGNFLCPNDKKKLETYHHLLFCLCRPHTYIPVLLSPEDRVAHLRMVVQRLSPPDHSEWIISYKIAEDSYVYATAVEQGKVEGKQCERDVNLETHCRWYTPNLSSLGSLSIESSVKNSREEFEDVIALANWSISFAMPRNSPKTYSNQQLRNGLIFALNDTKDRKPEIDHRLQSWFGLESQSPPSDLTFNLFYGDPETAALYRKVPLSGNYTPESPRQVPLEDVTKALQERRIDPRALLNQPLFELNPQNWVTMRALGAVAKIYEKLPSASISLNITSKPFEDHRWIDRKRQKVWYHSLSLTRAAAFSIITLLETGDTDLNPQELRHVLAISIGDSLYLAAPLISDPWDTSEGYDVRRVLGNVGRAGVSLLGSPEHPMVRKPKVDEWALINHDVYGGTAEDCFGDTSLHLSLTEYRVPYTSTHEGARDIQTFFQEAVISIHDRGTWVADVNILEALEKVEGKLERLPKQCPHRATLAASKGPLVYPADVLPPKITVADNWFEFLDKPHNPMIVRSHGNWVGRLAAAALSNQLGHPTVMLPPSCDMTCFGSQKFFQELVRGQEDVVFIY